MRLPTCVDRLSNLNIQSNVYYECGTRQTCKAAALAAAAATKHMHCVTFEIVIIIVEVGPPLAIDPQSATNRAVTLVVNVDDDEGGSCGCCRSNWLSSCAPRPMATRPKLGDRRRDCGSTIATS